jgi:hypothetical protein
MNEEKIKQTLLEIKTSPNKDLTSAMDFLQEDFEKTKELIVKLTYHLDSTEKAYNNLLEEYKNRVKK